MNVRRIWIMFLARTKEFYRDKGAFGWNLSFPFFIVLGFGIVFGDGSTTNYKIGIFPYKKGKANVVEINIPNQIKNMKYMKYIGISSLKEGIHKLRHHKIDLLININQKQPTYWVSKTSPQGYAAEQILLSSLSSHVTKKLVAKKTIKGNEIKYIDWLFPGVLAMNMMFSALWGVGWVIVRYRKNGVLKRLKATPLTALDYLTAQMTSRIFVLVGSTILVWIGCELIFSFTIKGSYLNILLIFFLGGFNFSALGLLFACRGVSEEFISGIINIVSMPMMFLSEVWFSLEGAPEWVRMIAKIFPLTHMNNAIRKVMHDGAGLYDISQEIILLAVITILSLLLGARLFKWN